MEQYILRVIPADLVGVDCLELLSRALGHAANRAIRNISDLVLELELAWVELVIP